MKPACELCGEPMPAGEEMFKFHGYSGPCPAPPKPQANVDIDMEELHSLAVLYGTRQMHREANLCGRVIARLAVVKHECVKFNEIIDGVEARCMATDGPVTPTLSEMREDELRKLWQSVQKIKAALAPVKRAAPAQGRE